VWDFGAIESGSMRARVRRRFTAIDRQETALPSRGRAGL
jgi:hypothetical protein